MGENGKEYNGKLTVMMVQYPVDDDLWWHMSGAAVTVATSGIMAAIIVRHQHSYSCLNRT